jgi:DNA-directed RNA polymerase specialized sigma24 family protein
MNDAEIINASLDDPLRFAVIFDRHARTVHRFVARRLGSSAAEDVTSEAFRIAFERDADQRLVTVVHVDAVDGGWAATRWLSAPC